MRGITFATFATLLLLVTSGMIGSGHIALAHNSRVIENSGNYQESQQSCDNSCTVTSSNVITQGSASRTMINPPMANVTQLILNVLPPFLPGGIAQAFVFLLTTGPCVRGCPVLSPITITFTGTGVPPNFAATLPNGAGQQVVNLRTPTTPGNYTAQAHFAGTVNLLPSDSAIVKFTVPSGPG